MPSFQCKDRQRVSELIRAHHEITQGRETIPFWIFKPSRGRSAHTQGLKVVFASQLADVFSCNSVSVGSGWREDQGGTPCASYAF
jgi:hypothetical protein